MFQVQQRAGPAIQPAKDQAAVQVQVGAAVVRAEGDDLRWNVCLQSLQLGEGFALDDGPIEQLLVAEQPRLGQRVVRHAGVTVHVIGRDVQQYPDGRAKVLNRLELERADLKRQKIQIACLID